MKEIISDTYSWDILDDFVSSLDPVAGEYTLAHNPSIPRILSGLFGYEPQYRKYVDDGTGRMAGFMNGVVIKGRFVSMPHFSYGGAACADPAVAMQIERSVSGEYEIRSFHQSSEYYSDKKVTAYLDLSGGHDSIFPGLKYNVRRQIRIASENGIEVKRGKSELLDDFLKVYRKNMTRLGSPPQPKRFFAALLDGWEHGEATIFCSYYKGKPVGGCFLLSFGGIIENCWAGTLYEYNKLFVPYLAYSEMIKYAIDSGYKVFSFGRSSKGEGTLGFKKHWKPEIKQLYFNQSGPVTGGLRDKKTLLSVYKKIMPQWANVLVGSAVTKYIY